MYHIVQPPLQKAHQYVSGITFGGFSPLEILAELPLQNAVVMLDFLFFPEMDAVVGRFAAPA